MTEQKNALDLIKRQQAEIEILQEEVKAWEEREDKMYEQAEASLAANIADGGTSCQRNRDDTLFLFFLLW